MPETHGFEKGSCAAAQHSGGMRVESLRAQVYFAQSFRND
jgi:hypothetical protein